MRLSHTPNHSRRALSVKGQDALDFRNLNGDGSAGVFNIKKKCNQARSRIARQDLTWLAGSLSRTVFRLWKCPMGHSKMNPQLVDAELNDGRRSLAIVCELFRQQITHCKCCLHEHTALAQSVDNRAFVRFCVISMPILWLPIRAPSASQLRGSRRVCA